MNIETLYAIFSQCSGICIDTRKLEPGNIFFALKGPSFDGNTFALEALAQGAIHVVVDDASQFESASNITVVEEVLIALQQLANHHRHQMKATIIALTGSNGKTTTKELIYKVLSSQYTTQCTIGNLNNHIGVALTLLDLKASTQFLVLEMGANHQGEIESYCMFADPDYGYITNIGKAHLEGFGGIEGVKKGKSELYRYIGSHGKGIFVDENDDVLVGLLPNVGISLYKYKSSNIVLISESPYLSLASDGKVWQLQLAGSYNIPNIAAARAIGIHFGIETSDIWNALTSYLPNNNRSEIEEFNDIRIFKDAYNANPTSMLASLTSFLQNYGNKETIFVVGDMMEMGSFTDDEHLHILNWLDQHGVINCVLVGRHFYKYKANFPNFHFSETSILAIDIVKSMLPNGRTIFLKGSRSIKLELITEALKYN